MPTILAAADAGQLELNVMMPVMAWNGCTRRASCVRPCACCTTRCVAGIRADEERCRELLDRSTALATALSPHIGYAETADIAKTAVRTGRSDPRPRPGARAPARETLDAHPVRGGDDFPGIARERTKDDSAVRTKNPRSVRLIALALAASVGRAADRGTTRAAVSAAGSRAARGSRSTTRGSARPDHGRSRDRGGKRRR